jgi:hypothetical protein
LLCAVLNAELMSNKSDEDTQQLGQQLERSCSVNDLLAAEDQPADEAKGGPWLVR